MNKLTFVTFFTFICRVLALREEEKTFIIFLFGAFVLAILSSLTIFYITLQIGCRCFASCQETFTKFCLRSCQV